MKKLSLLVLLGVVIPTTFVSSYAATFDADCDTNAVILDFTNQIPTSQEENLIWDNSGMTQLVRFLPAIFTSMPQAIPLAQKQDFQTMAVKVQMTDYDPSMLAISFRVSRDGNFWEDWTLLEQDHEGVLSDTVFTSRLLFLPVETQFFQVSLEFAPSFSGTPPPKIQRIRFNSFSPVGSSPISPSEVVEHSFPGSNEDCDCPLPAHASRTDWGSPDGQNPSCSSPAYAPVTHLIVHHSYTSNTSSNWAAVVLSIWNYHVVNNGWCDIGYNWLIDPNGVIYEGRGGGNNVRGAHFCGTNTATMGVCMLGTFIDTPPTAAAMQSLEALLTWKSCDSEIDPTTSSLHISSGKLLPHIAGHQDGCNTLCPGDQLYNLLAGVQQNVSQELEQCQATSISDLISEEIQVYPNPSTGNFFVRIEAKSAEQVSFSLFNRVGQLVYKQKDQLTTGTNAIPLETSTLSPGMYHLHLQTPKGVLSKKILIQ